MQVAFVDLKAQYESIKKEMDEAIFNVIKDSAFIGGKYLTSFEKHYAEFLGIKHCIGVANGTDAIYIALKTLGIGNGDEVITVANSFIATSEAISETGARVVFVDCDEKTFNIDTKKIKEAVTSKTKAIVPVHLYGLPANMDEIIAFAQKHNLYVVEDCAQAHGAKFNEKLAGTMGEFGCFSFFPGKNLGAYGDAGAIVTNNDRFAEKARMFANHGRKAKYNHEFEGVNSRLDGLQAAILDVKLKYLDKWTDRRIAVAERYNKELRDICIVPEGSREGKHVYHLYVIRINNRDKVQEFLSKNGVAVGLHYPIPLPFLDAYKYLGKKPQDFPVANQLKNEILSIPIHGSIRDDEVTYVIEQIKLAKQACGA